MSDNVIAVSVSEFDALRQRAERAEALAYVLLEKIGQETLVGSVRVNAEQMQSELDGLRDAALARDQLSDALHVCKMNLEATEVRLKEMYRQRNHLRWMVNALCKIGVDGKPADAQTEWIDQWLKEFDITPATPEEMGT